jgi:predicted mannosyl-3-phosphoglycerate phosphatase (HAD superfamily)
MVNEQMGIEEIGKRMKILADKWKPSFAIFEVNGFQSAVAKEAQQIPGMPPIAHVVAQQAKYVRATPAMIAAENGQIHLPSQGMGDVPLPWVRAFTQQAIQFRGVGDEDDDMIDVLSYAILRKNSLGMRKDVAVVGEAPPVVEYEQPLMPEDWTIGASRFLIG